MEHQQFKHGKDYQKAKSYLIEIGVYDDVVKTSLFGGSDFEIIIAANIEYNSRNKQVQNEIH